MYVPIIQYNKTTGLQTSRVYVSRHAYLFSAIFFAASISLNMDEPYQKIIIFIYDVHISTSLLAGWQHKHMSVTVWSIGHEDTVLAPYSGVHLEC